MSNRPWHRRYHSDALAGFMSLSLEERGAYQTLLDLIYDRGGPIMDNERLLAGYMGCSIRKWRALREKLLQIGKIVLTDCGEISNSRAEKELENDAKTSRKHAENGLKGGQVRAENADSSNENSRSKVARLQPGSSLNQKPDTRGQNKKKLSTSGKGGTRATWPPDLVEQAGQLAKAIQLRSHPSAADMRQLQAWLADGLIFDWHILEAANAMAAKASVAGRRIGSFSYLDPGVREYAADWQADRDRLRVIAGGKR